MSNKHDSKLTEAIDLPAPNSVSEVLSHQCPLGVADVIAVRRHLYVKQLVMFGIKQPVVKRLAAREAELLDITINHLLPEVSKTIATQQELRRHFFETYSDDPIAVYDALMQVASMTTVDHLRVLAQLAGNLDEREDAIINIDVILNSSRQILLRRLLNWKDGQPIYAAHLPKEI